MPHPSISLEPEKRSVALPSTLKWVGFEATTSCKSTWDTVPYFWHKWPVHELVLVIPPPPLIKVATNTRPCSKLGGTTLNGREEGGQYYILQTCDQERFEARKVVFSWECLNIFATGCSFQPISPGLGVFQGQSSSPSLIIISLITIPREKYYTMLCL